MIPLFASNKPWTTHVASSSMVAFAGHVRSGIGQWCECGSNECICDPGETPNSKIIERTPRKRPISNPTNSSGLGEIALLGALILTMLLRFSLR